MQGRTVILVSHHVQLCAPGASYITALDNGRVLFEGSKEDFYSSGIIKTLVQSTDSSGENAHEEEKAAMEKDEEETILAEEREVVTHSETSSTLAPSPPVRIKTNKPPRKLVEDEKREVGHIGRAVWETYIQACGNEWYWLFFISVFVTASTSSILANSWIGYAITYLL